MPETQPPLADLTGLSLAEIAQAVAERRLPPIASWNPARHGDSAMRIARDGTWYHKGSPITRPAMVRLFATLLRREPDGGFVLVTPAEKLAIAVEDSPFLAVEVKSEGVGRDRRLAFRLNIGEVVIADAAHPLRFAATPEGPLPNLLVRGGLEARVTRSVYYELATIALEEADDNAGKGARDDAAPPGLWSAGAFFPFEPAA